MLACTYACMHIYVCYTVCMQYLCIPEEGARSLGIGVTIHCEPQGVLQGFLGSGNFWPYVLNRYWEQCPAAGVECPVEGTPG